MVEAAADGDEQNLDDDDDDEGILEDLESIILGYNEIGGEAVLDDGGEIIRDDCDAPILDDQGDADLDNDTSDLLGMPVGGHQQSRLQQMGRCKKARLLLVYIAFRGPFYMAWKHFQSTSQ